MREWPPLTPKRTQGALPLDPAIARFGLEELLSLRNRVSAVFCCDTIWLAPIIRCRSAHLVEVQPNFCLLWICTILLMPAKAALLRSPHFNRKNDRVSGRFTLFWDRGCPGRSSRRDSPCWFPGQGRCGGTVQSSYFVCRSRFLNNRSGQFPSASAF